jgi:hypothetical protein
MPKIIGELQAKTSSAVKEKIILHRVSSSLSSMVGTQVGQRRTAPKASAPQSPKIDFCKGYSCKSRRKRLSASETQRRKVLR